MPTQLNIPGLQRVSVRSCIVCGARADLFCARCAVTPYCSELCQRKDWPARHSAVCHNLMRLNAASGAQSKSPADIDANSNVRVPSPPPPLRRPRSPNANQNHTQRNGFVNNKENKMKFVPPGHHPPPQRAPATDPRNSRFNQNQQQRQDTNEDEEWGATDKIAQDKPAAKPESVPTHMGQKISPKPAYDKPKSKFEIPKTNFETPKSNFEKPKSKIEMPMAKDEMLKAKEEMPKAKEEKPKEASLVKKAFSDKTRIAANLTSEIRIQPSTPDIALVPAQYLIEKLPIGEAFVLSVEQPTSVCGTKQPGFVCLAMHADYQDQYKMLLEDIFEGENAIVPKPGTTFAYLDPADEGWYRARCLNSTQCALLDGSRLAIMAQGQCRALTANCANIPEFCCVLRGKAEVGMSLKCTILMKTGDEFKVSLDGEDDVYLGEGTITRWMPDIEIPQTIPKESNPLLKKQTIKTPALNTKPQPPEAKPIPQSIPQKPQEVQKSLPDTPRPSQEVQKSLPDTPRPSQEVQKSLPDIPRPDVRDNGRYLLLHVTSLSRACVRACDDETTREFESVLQDVAVYGAQSGKRLTEPPVAGQVVLCLYEGVHYRALVTRTKAADNKFKVQYAEYANEEVVQLEKLFACPPELSLTARPARASIVSLSTITHSLTEPAEQYLESLKEVVELIATIPSGAKTAPSGSLVQLSLAKNKENINKKLEQMVTPEWRKLELAGGDVIESDVVLLSDMETLPLPTSKPFVLRVTDISSLKSGIISGFELGTSLAPTIYGPLTDKINEYCSSSLCSEPYLPMVEEVCLARMQPYPQWFRAVVISHTAGEKTASVLYLDYGNVGHCVPVADLRKCMKELTEHPALAALILIQDWPEKVTDVQLLKACTYLQVDEEGCGQLQVKRCTMNEDGTYTIVHPELIAAINSL